MTITIDDMVRREVVACASTLISTLAQGFGCNFQGGKTEHEISVLCEQAHDLYAPRLDYEEAAIQAGWSSADTTKGMLVNDKMVDDRNYAAAIEPNPDGSYDWATACQTSNVEPYDCEICEHWIVSPWLAEELEAKGERIDHDFAGWHIWGRTTTGQAIASDHVIGEIYAELIAPHAGETARCKA